MRKFNPQPLPLSDVIHKNFNSANAWTVSTIASDASYLGTCSLFMSCILKNIKIPNMQKELFGIVLHNNEIPHILIECAFYGS